MRGRRVVLGAGPAAAGSSTRKIAPPAGAIVHGDLAAQTAHDVAADEQPQTGALAGRMAGHEWLEHAFALGGGHAGPVSDTSITTRSPSLAQG